MVFELNFSTYFEVTHSWERIRRIKDYKKTLGILVFNNFLSRYPDATYILGLEGEAEECANTGSFVPRAEKFVGFCDTFLDMLGPNTDMLTDYIEEEGRKNARHGVRLEHYPAMGEALIEGVRTLDKKFNDDTELCWRRVYGGVTNDMRKAAIHAKAGRRHTI